MDPTSESNQENLEEIPQGLKTPSRVQQSNENLISELSLSPVVHISLKNPTNDPTMKKSTSLGQTYIIESLNERQLLLETKLTNKRIACKANAIGQMRQAPEINNVSKKLGEAKNKSTIPVSLMKSDKNTSKIDPDYNDSPMMQGIIKKNIPSKSEDTKSPRHKMGKINEEAKEPEVKVVTRPSLEEVLGSPLPVDIFKNIKSPGTKSESKPEDPNKPLVERSMNWKAKVDKKKAQWRQEKDKKIMQSCTFKPQLIPKPDPLANKTNTQTLNQNAKTNKKALSMKSLSPSAFTKYITDVDLYPCEYSQLSPTNFTIRHSIGFNITDFMAKAKPMANYQNFDEELRE
ncbi:hypothetical protein SteCoe_7167 [Stentor coeruleus]|uniref:Uncharacterized protein n=1 Tax=Stentor coeruleus TaxID=5963 RepID=A0A1R2CNC6_9CILI|nr:hypothetical protein SteCoe_7167 [Stentor coeruleus]